MSNKIKNLTKNEKIAILQKISKGEMTVKQGVFISNSAMVVIHHKNKYYTDDSLETEIPLEVMADYTGNVIILPPNNR